jgi:hypothetical protein
MQQEFVIRKTENTQTLVLCLCNKQDRVRIERGAIKERNLSGATLGATANQ